MASLFCYHRQLFPELQKGKLRINQQENVKQNSWSIFRLWKKTDACKCHRKSGLVRDGFFLLSKETILEKDRDSNGKNQVYSSKCPSIFCKKMAFLSES
jgi:hypothetical protein